MNKLLIVTIVGVTKFRPAVMRKGLEIFGHHFRDQAMV